MKAVTPVVVRPAVPADIPQLLALVRRYWDYEHISGFDALRVELLLQQLLSEPRLGAACWRRPKAASPAISSP
jgi:hypothetical protein